MSLKLKYWFFIIILMVLFNPYGLKDAFAETKEVPFTLADRDRIIQIEEKLNSQQIQISEIRKDIRGNKDDIQSVRDDIQSVRDEIQSVRNELATLFYSGFAFMGGFMALILGFCFLIWGRLPERSTIKKKPYSASKREKLLEKILKEFATEQPKLAEILKANGL